MKTLFGGSESKSTNQGGFGALPSELQNRFLSLGRRSQEVLNDPSRFFSPMDITGEEQSALSRIQNSLSPDSIRQGVSNFMNPFMDIVTRDINRRYEDEFSGVNQAASRAGAFGSSRQEDAMYDVERARADAIRSAQQQAFDPAMRSFLGQQQQSIQNLLGFGGLRRGVDIAQRGALPSALGLGTDVLSPLLSTRQGESQSDSQRGIIPGLF